MSRTQIRKGPGAGVRVQLMDIDNWYFDGDDLYGMPYSSGISNYDKFKEVSGDSSKIFIKGARSIIESLDPMQYDDIDYMGDFDSENGVFKSIEIDEMKRTLEVHYDDCFYIGGGSSRINITAGQQIEMADGGCFLLSVPVWLRCDDDTLIEGWVNYEFCDAKFIPSDNFVADYDWLWENDEEDEWSYIYEASAKKMKKSMLFKDDMRSFFIDITDYHTGFGPVIDFDWQGDDAVEIKPKDEKMKFNTAFKQMFKDAVESIEGYIERHPDYSITYFDENNCIVCISEGDTVKSTKKMKKSIPVWNKIEKRCPKGYHKNPKTGQCESAEGLVLHNDSSGRPSGKEMEVHRRLQNLSNRNKRDGKFHKPIRRSKNAEVTKGHGNYYDAIENFIVDNGEVGPYYNDIYDEFIDVLTEDDIMDAIEYLINEGTICYNENNERFEVCAKGVRKMKKSDDDEIICPYCGEVARPSRDPAGAYVAYCNHCDRPLEEEEISYGYVASTKKQYIPDMPSVREMTDRMRNTRTYRIGE